MGKGRGLGTFFRGARWVAKGVGPVWSADVAVTGVTGRGGGVSCRCHGERVRAKRARFYWEGVSREGCRIQRGRQGKVAARTHPC